ncbi:hypothetical protein BASA60_001851 [Batrachochytrium salamandrivorans]|nr:hypothetical protein BASA60_001851 [Batrachochytrium salamandrivorans]
MLPLSKSHCSLQRPMSKTTTFLQLLQPSRSLACPGSLPSAWFAAQNQDTLDSATNCGVEGDILTLSRFELSPDPPQRGNPLNILLDGLLSEPVGKGAVAQVTVKLGFIQIIDHPYDLCDQVSAVDLECPIPAGPISVKKAFDIPHELPPGHYRINVNVHTADERHIGCLSADFRM